HELKSLTFLDVLDARNNGFPQRFCYQAPFQMDFKLQSFVENSAVVFAPPGTAVKLLASSSITGNALLLTNSSPQFPAGTGYALRAQPQFRKATSDILNGLIFYLALLLPFAYFTERLVLASSSLAKQLLGSAAIFVMAFMLLRFLHPAFDLTGNSFMIFVAF